MAYRIAPTQPPPRPPNLVYGERGPGLYPGETVVLIAGKPVAVSVSIERLETGGGVSMKGWARAIEKHGETKLDSAGREIELDHIHSFGTDTLETLKRDGKSGEEIAARELILLMLGEPLTRRDKLAKGSEVGALPIIPWSEAVQRSCSIRNALLIDSLSTPEFDVSSVL